MPRSLVLLALAACAPEATTPVAADGLARGAEALSWAMTLPGVAPGDSLDSEVDDLLLDLVDSATTSVDAALYDFNDAAIAEALIAAADRGVEVRFVGDADEAAQSGYVALATAKIPMSLRPTSSAIMHDKFVVVDGAAVWTGSTNASYNDLYRNNNNVLVIRDAALAGLYAAEFDQMARGLFGTKKVAKGGTATVGDATVTVKFSPKDAVLSELDAAAAAASETLFFQVFTYTHDSVADRMIALHEAGVQVVGIMDASQSTSTYAEDDRLAAAGIPVYLDGNENKSGFAGGKLHHKVLLADPFSASPVVVTGSTNWTASAMSTNDENLLVIEDDQALAWDLAREFCDRLDEATLHPAYTGDEPAPCGAFTSPVIVNEVNPGGDWLELVNTSDRGVSLAGWSVADVALSGTIAPGAALVVSRTKAPRALVAADLSLGDTGDVVVLRDAAGHAVDVVRYAGEAGASLNRAEDGVGGALVAADASPGKRADGRYFGAVLVINEAMVDPDGTDRGFEWVEIVNAGDRAADLSGLVLADAVADRHALSGSLAAGGVLVIAESDAISGAVVASTGSLQLTNTGETLTLRDAAVAVADQVVMGKAVSGVSFARATGGDLDAAFVFHTAIDGTKESRGTL